MDCRSRAVARGRHRRRELYDTAGLPGWLLANQRDARSGARGGVRSTIRQPGLAGGPPRGHILVERWRTSRGLSRHAKVTHAVLALLCLTLAGCAEQDGELATSPATVGPATDEASVTTELGPIVWASEIDPETSAPADRRETFSRDEKTIYALVETGPLAEGTTLTAAWSFNEQPIEGIDVTVTADEARGAGWVAFQLEWNGDTLWPTGILAVRVTASTGESAESSVEIEGT